MFKATLFCLPYAGGSASYYGKWKPNMGPHIDLHPVELSGRGRRLSEPFYESFEDAVLDILKNIEKDLVKAPYALFGHSMGSMLLFELAIKIFKKRLPGPMHVFVSGRGAPSQRANTNSMHLLPDNEFKDEILKLGGTKEEIFKNPELSDIFLPILKNDYRIIEHYTFKEKDFKLQCDVSVLYGKEDNIVTGDITAWQNYTQGKCSFIRFDGGHFFIDTYEEKIIKIINDTLKNYK